MDPRKRRHEREIRSREDPHDFFETSCRWRSGNSNIAKRRRGQCTADHSYCNVLAWWCASRTVCPGFFKAGRTLTAGKVKFQIFPAGTIGSPLKITELVQKKVAQAGHTWPGYDWGIDKAAAIFGGYVGSPPAEALLHWIYSGGGIDLWRQWRLEKFGVVGIPCGAHSDEIHMHSRKPIRTLEDLKGLKLRTSGAWAEVANNLGASTVILPGGEVYPALERGVVDAIEWATPGINLGLGFHKVAKYIILPGVHQPGAVLECQFDKALWNHSTPTQRRRSRLRPRWRRSSPG